jgi:hypothetical protein
MISQKKSKKNIWIIFVLLIFTFLFSRNTQAQGPFAGKIVSVRTPSNVQCGASVTSPFIVNSLDGVPMVWSTLPLGTKVGIIQPGAWIIGMSSLVPGGCVTTSVPPVPFPTRTTNFYGTSARF